ncbi:DUF7674 family protein [Kitasatospora arboriphila]|uniref:DUF7674 domain-containing protein n=1 Tax=Kitasatospora arboriphila TaxID=258052 RepID=A0ABN1U702_9ACTN
MATPDWCRQILAISDLLSVDETLPGTLLASSLGDSFASHAHELTTLQCEQVLAVIENMLATGSEQDRAAAATGFLEALLDAWDRGFELRTVWSSFGPISRSYCLEWNEFSGIASPEWMHVKA